MRYTGYEGGRDLRFRSVICYVFGGDFVVFGFFYKNKDGRIYLEKMLGNYSCRC